MFILHYYYYSEYSPLLPILSLQFTPHYQVLICIVKERMDDGAKWYTNNGNREN